MLQERLISLYNSLYNPAGSLSSEGEIDKEKPTHHFEQMDTYDEQHGE